MQGIAGQIPPSELDALRDLFVSTNGIMWQWSGTGLIWDFSPPDPAPCSPTARWEGLTCSSPTSSQLGSVTTLSLAGHNMTGTLPSTLSALSNLEVLDLNSNHLHGPVPASLDQLAFLTELHLASNHLTGNMPASIGSIPMLRVLAVDDNHLSGPLPQELRQLTELSTMTVDNNLLTGTLPDWICEFTNMILLNVKANQMEGAFPPCVFAMQRMKFLSAGSNAFHGTLPDSISTLTNLMTLDLTNSLFTGALPEALYSLPALEDLHLPGNHFTGTISSLLGGMTAISQVVLVNNMLTGTLPCSISNMRWLYYLGVTNNLLSGSLDCVFNHHTQAHLEVVSLGDNQFTGTLPEEVFLVSNLSVFFAFSNCLDAAIPSAICRTSKLTSLVLDGVHTATSCRDRLFPRSTLLDAYMLSDQTTYEIPSCLFSLPLLTTLHLSGMGMEGSLPDNLQIGNSLVDLSLSHNFLHGSIPLQFQNRSWQNLDLSFNFLTGNLSNHHLSSDGNTIDSLSLQVNKLSGGIPNAMKTVQNITILDGNIFHCDYSGNQLPHRDSAIGNYDCGSNSFNASYYIWLATIVLVLLLQAISVLLVGMYGLSQNEEMSPLAMLKDTGSLFRRVLAWLSAMLAEQSERMAYLWNLKHAVKGMPESTRSSLIRFSKALDNAWKMCGRLTAYMLIVLVPVYVTGTVYFGTYSNQYAWTVSIAYLAGNEACAMELVVLLVLLCGWLASLHDSIRKEKPKTVEYAEVELSPPCGKVVAHEQMELAIVPFDEEDCNVLSDKTGQSTLTTDPSSPAPVLHDIHHPPWLLATVCALIFVINLALVGGINIAFAYVSINGSNKEVFIMQVALAMFGYFWNSDRIQWLSTEMLAWYSGSKSLLSMKHTRYFDSAYLLQLHAKEIDEQQQMLSVQLWIALINAVFIPSIVTAALSSSCFYYALRAAPQVKATYDINICLSRSIDANSGLLVCDLSGRQATTSSYDPPFTYSYQCSSVLLAYYAPSLMYTCITDGFLSPLVQYWTARLHQWLMTVLDAMNDERCCKSMLTKLVGWMKWRVVPDLLQAIDAEDGYRGQTYLSAQGLMINLVTYTALLLTFGAVFPPLGIALAATIVVYMCYNRWLLGRFLTNLEHQSGAGMNSIHAALTLESGSLPSVLHATKWMLLTTACWFYAMFMADTIGYTHGIKLSYWVIVFMALMPLAFYSADRFTTFAEENSTSEKGMKKSRTHRTARSI